MAVTEAGRRELFKRMTADMGVTLDETIGGLALIVLGILALARFDPPLLNAIATIIAGVALMIVSAGLAVELNRVVSESEGHALNIGELEQGLNAGVLGGIAGVVLGILAILDVARLTLIAVALIVFGAAVLFDFIARAQVRSLKMMTGDASEQSARLAVSVASGTDTATIAAGVALITLGILALSGVAGGILVSVALLSLGSYLFLEGSVVVGRMTFWMTMDGRSRSVL